MADLRGARGRWTRIKVLSCASAFAGALGLAALPAPAAAFERVATASVDLVDGRAPGITTAEEDDPWLSFVLGYLPVATAALTQTSPTRTNRVPDCRPGPGCIMPPIRFPALATRDVPFGPIDRHGWAMFAAIGDRRMYAYPSPAKDGRISRADAWDWGVGAQFDAQALAAGSASSRTRFVVGELGGGAGGESSDAGYEVRARLVFGGDALGPLITASAMIGFGVDDPMQAMPAAFTCGAKLEIRF
ncbi:MAG: hypothetical protein WAS73_19185 [Defluviicoccus sp.]